MKTSHKSGCARVFNRYDATCPRCLELMNGAKAREGWGDWKRAMEARQVAAIRSHNCKERACGPVCTFGDW